MKQTESNLRASLQRRIFNNLERTERGKVF